MSMVILAVFLVVLTSFISAISQLLLKLSANEQRNGWLEYFNIKVITAYFLLGFTILINAFAMRWLSYKFAVSISSSSYIFVLVLGKWGLGETLDRSKIWGMFLILIGIVIFML